MSSARRAERPEDTHAVVERILAAHFGLRLGAYSAALVEMALSGLPDSREDPDPAVLRQMLTSFAIGETSFLRHPEHFEALSRLFPTLPPRSAGSPLRVWSAGCATGEEAYSLAATLRGSGPVDVLGSDVNPASIARAHEGAYRLWSLRGVALESACDWLEVDALEVRVQPELGRRVRFDVRNLVKDPFPLVLHVVFCRNVLLYFEPEAARRVYEKLAESLLAGGVLFIGYGDPEPPLDLFIPGESEGVRYFRRAGHRSDEPVAVRELKLPRPSSPPNGAGPDAGRELDHDEALAVVRGLAGQRAFGAALELLDELVQTPDFALAVEAHVLTAMIADEAGERDLARDAARRAHFLAPTDPVPLYLLGSALERSGSAELARDRLAQARHALTRFPDLDAPLPHGEGLTGRQLRKMIDARLEPRP